MLDDRLPVFLDNGPFSKLAFNTHSLQLASLESLVNKDLIRLVTTDIVVREAHAGISRRIKEAAAAYDKYATFDHYLGRTGTYVSFTKLDALQVERISFPNLDTIFVETNADKQRRLDMGGG